MELWEWRQQLPTGSPEHNIGPKMHPDPTMEDIYCRDATLGLLVEHGEPDWPPQQRPRLAVCRAVQTCCLQLILHNGLLIPKLCISPSQHRVVFLQG